MTRISLLISAVALATLSTYAHADTLFTGTLGVNRSINLFDVNQFDLDIAFLDNQLNPTNLVRLFDDLVVTPGNVGDTFEATAVNDPTFLTAVQRLTDASSEYIQTILTEDEAGGLSETQGPPESTFFLFGTPSSPPNPAEVTITSIDLRIDKFILLPNGGAGSNQPLDLSMTLTLNGTPIPEPSTGWLIACGLATLSPLWLLRRRRPQLA